VLSKSEGRAPVLSLSEGPTPVLSLSEGRVLVLSLSEGRAPVLSKSEVHLFVYSESCRGEAQGLVYRHFARGQVFSLLTGEILLISYLTSPSEGQIGLN